MSTAAVTPADVGQHYDELDGFYRELWGLHVHHGYWTTGKETPDEATNALTDKMADLLQLKEGERVCDIGCGYGESARRLVRERGVRVTGVTVSQAQHAKAVEITSADNPGFIWTDWLKNDFADESFDKVISIECISHIPDRAAVFREAARVLKPGGRMVICDWLAGDMPKAWEQKHLLDPICREGRLPDLNPVADYWQWITDAGLEPTYEEDISKNVAKTWTLVMQRMAKAVVTDAKTRKYLLDRSRTERSFALSPMRLRLAFATGAFRFVMLGARKA